MKRTSPIFMLLLAAGCANAGIGDWFNPFHVFGSKQKHPHGPVGGPVVGASAPAGVAHSPRSGHGLGLGPSLGGSGPHHHPGHRGARHLAPVGPGPQGYSHGANYHTTHAHAPPAPLLGSLPGTLDDGFKPSFPPGFANPPSYSPNLNPFATVAGHGSEALAKGPFLPSQLTQYHTPQVDPKKAQAPLVKPVALPNGHNRVVGRFRHGRPSKAVIASASGLPDFNGPSGLNEFPGLNSPLEVQSAQPEFEETPTTRPQNAPQQRPRGGPFSFLTRGRRPGPPRHRNPHHQHHHHGAEASGRPGGFLGRPGNSGPPSGPPGGGPEGPNFIDGDGAGLESNPFGSDGPTSNPFQSGQAPANLFSSDGPLSGGPGPLGGSGGGGGNSPLSGISGINGGNRDVFFASSPGANTPFAPQVPSQGPGGPSPFNGNRPGQNLFGQGQSAPQGPPQRGQNNFFGGNDYSEQFQGGPRGPRQPANSQDDYRPQPNGPPDSNDEQSGGFFGAIHDSENQNYFSGQGGPGGPGGPPSFDGPSGSPFGNNGPEGPSQFGNTIQAGGEGGPGFGPRPQQAQRGRRPGRFGLQGFRNLFQGSSSNLPSHNRQNLQMSASGAKPAIAVPSPKAGGLLPLLRKSASAIIPLSSPKDPNYRPLRLGASSLSPVSAPFEPLAAASGYGGYGNAGLSHNGDRILYHVGGHKGPHSYQFGYDTGKGHNRIFRFEEKDGSGFVKGKYGFYDKSGKLNIINYMAHPKHGYHAERGHSHGYY